LSSGFGDVVEDVVEELGSFGLVVVLGVVALAEEDGDVLGSGLEVGAGFAGGFHAAFELGGACAKAVAEHAGMGFFAESVYGCGNDFGG
jgi:hypothetical protein